MQTPKKFSSFSDQVSWISDEKGIKIKDREYAEEMLRQIGYFPLMGGYKHLFRISNTKKYKVGTSFEEYTLQMRISGDQRHIFSCLRHVKTDNSACATSSNDQIFHPMSLLTYRGISISLEMSPFCCK